MYDRAAELPVWRLEYESYPGLVVRARQPTVEALAVVRRVVPLLQSPHPLDVAAAVAQLAEPFATSLLSWTLLKDGEPVPATGRGVLELDLPFAAVLIGGWFAKTSPTAEVEPTESAEAVSAEEELERNLPMTVLVPEAEAEPALVG